MRSLKRTVLFLVGLLAGLAVALFIYDNTGRVSLAFYSKQTIDLPLSLVVILSFGAGALVMFLLHFGGVWETFLDRRRLSQRVEELEEELVALRNLPLTEAAIDLERPRPRKSNEPALVPEVLPAEGRGEGELYVGVSDRAEG